MNVRRGHRYRTQHGFIGSPVAADLDGDGGDLEIVAANMDRHVYAWHADGSAVAGFPVLAIDRSKITAIDPQTHAPTFAGGIGGELQPGRDRRHARPSGDLTGDGKPEIVVGTNEEYAPATTTDRRRRLQRRQPEHRLARAARPDAASWSSPTAASTRSSRRASRAGPPSAAPTAYLTGWPKKVGFIFAELLPVVGEGITGSPVIGAVNCPISGGSGPKVGAISGAGPGYIFNPDGSPATARSEQAQDNAMQTDFAVGTGKFDTPAIPLSAIPPSATSPAARRFMVPAAGVIRALDLGVNEYQGGQDFVAAYDAATGQFRPASRRR